MRIVFMPADETGCGYYRMRLPAKELAKRGHEVAITSQLSMVDISFDVYVFQRVMNPYAFLFINELKRKGKVVVHDLDDAFDALPEWNPVKVSSESLLVIKELVKLADLNTFSTVGLKKKYDYLSDKAVVLPNCIDPDDYAIAKPNNHFVLTVGWAGTATHDGDLKVVEQVIYQTIKRHKEVIFIMAGGVPPDMFNHKQIIKFNGVQMAHYVEIIKPFDIGLIPLANNVFNRCKSHIKGLEYSACGIPIIAYPTPEYKRFIEHGVNGYLAATALEWSSSIEALIGDEKKRKIMGAAAKRNAEKYYIANKIHLWEEAYARAKDERG